MNNIFSGLIAFFIGLTAMFHGGNTAPPTANPTPTIQQTLGSETASPSGAGNTPGQQRGQRRGGVPFGNMPSGSTPIFGQVNTVNGNTITVSMMRRGRPGTSPTPAAPVTLTIDLSSTTKFQGGTQSDIQNGTKIAGYGTKNSDGSINAQQIMINPPMPSRGPRNDQDSGL